MKQYIYKPGEWNCTCQVCGFRFPASKIKHRWDGLLVCKSCWEPRHPQDLLRVPSEDTSVPFSSPEPDPVFIPVCSINGQTHFAGYASAGCARLGNGFLVDNSIPQSTFGTP